MLKIIIIVYVTLIVYSYCINNHENKTRNNEDYLRLIRQLKEIQEQIMKVEGLYLAGLEIRMEEDRRRGNMGESEKERMEMQIEDDYGNMRVINLRDGLPNVDIFCKVSKISGKQIIGYKKIFSFQTQTNSYLAANVILDNHKQQYTFAIFSSQCKLLSIFNPPSNSPTHITNIITDRNIIQHGTLYFITNDLTIYSCHQTNNFTDYTFFTSLPNNNFQLIGGIVRHKGSNKDELFLIQRNGPIMVFDHNGNNKLLINVEIGCNIVKMVDHHPQPILISQDNWMYLLDTIHYTLVISKCPYPILGNIQNQVVDIIANNPYSSYFYLLMAGYGVLKYEIKNNKECQVMKHILPYDYHTQQKYQQIENVQEFQGNLYIGNRIVNISEDKVLSVKSQCSQFQYTFKGWRNSQKSGFIGLICCQENQLNSICDFRIIKAKQVHQISRKTTIVLTVMILLFLWMLFCFFKSSEPKLNFDEIEARQYEKYNKTFQEQTDYYLKKKINRSSPENNKYTRQKAQEKSQPKLKNTNLYDKTKKNQ